MTGSQQPLQWQCLGWQSQYQVALQGDAGVGGCILCATSIRKGQITHCSSQFSSFRTILCLGARQGQFFSLSCSHAAQGVGYWETGDNECPYLSSSWQLGHHHAQLISGAQCHGQAREAQSSAGLKSLDMSSDTGKERWRCKSQARTLHL